MKTYIVTNGIWVVGYYDNEADALHHVEEMKRDFGKEYKIEIINEGE